MHEADLLIRTKLHLPFSRPELVPRPRLQEQIARGLSGPLTLITAPAGYGKTTLLASFIAHSGMPTAWLSLDKYDNQSERFLNYLIAALQEADRTIGNQAAQLLSAARQPRHEAVLTSIINDLDITGRDIALVLDDYQFISDRTVHEAVAFLLEHCPRTLHLVIATRSDPPLPLARLRMRGQTVELRSVDLSFTEGEAAQFLNDIMGLRLDTGSVAVLEERTEGWVAGLQMASIALQSLGQSFAASSHLSMPNRREVSRFIEGFSGTHRYILDYLLDEVLAGQPPEIQRFLMYTSILERLTPPLCDAVLEDGVEASLQGGRPSSRSPAPVAGPSASILEYLERANLFLVPLDDERTWYRYHHLFAELLRAQLQRSAGAQGVARLHVRAAEWHRHHGSILEAINHASAASDDERVERLIEQHYMEMVRRGEMVGMRLWAGKLSREQVYRRPWLCIFEAYSHAWFGELDEADVFLEAAEKQIHSEMPSPGERGPELQAMLAVVSYVRSRITAMGGDIDRAIENCLAARANIPAGNLALYFDTGITLGFEYFLQGDYASAGQVLNETIRTAMTTGAVIYAVAASCVLARLVAVQGRLHESYDIYLRASRLIPEPGGHLDAQGLVDVGMADVLCEWNDLDAALAQVRQGLALLPHWGKPDDTALAYVTLARIHLARANWRDAKEALEKASQITQGGGVFSEAREAVDVARVRLSLAEGDSRVANRWAASTEGRLGADDRFRFENELAHFTRARVLIEQNRCMEAIGLLSRLEEGARSGGRLGRVVQILLLQALARRQTGNSASAMLALRDCLAIAEPESYARVFLDEGPPMRSLLATWLEQASAGHLRDYVVDLLSQFDDKRLTLERRPVTAAHDKTSPAGGLVEPLSGRELEVLNLMALGRTNPEIAQQLIVAPGTIKAHAASIYRKLDVANRTEAVTRARQLGLLT